MAGYIIYSLDWGKFQQFVERPTPDQLATFASRLCDGLEEYEFDEGDPMRTWPTKAKALASCEVEGEQTGEPWKEDAGLMEFLRTL